jgi:hypothetical protein
VKPAVRTAYGPVPVVELEQLGTHAAWSVWLMHAVLRREFERQRPAIGEAVLVRYLGRAQPDGGGDPYEVYRVVVDRPDENTDVDWTAIAARHGDESEPAPTPTPANEADDEIPF